MALAVGLEPLGDGLFGLFDTLAIKEAGVDHNAGLAVGKGLFFDVAALDDLDYRAVKLLCELPVPCIVGGNGHDGTCAVAHKYIVGNEYRDPAAVYGINGHYAFELYAGLFLLHLGALEVGLSCRNGLIFLDGVIVGQLVMPLFDIGMLGRHDHICCAEQRIGAGRINEQLVTLCRLELDLRAGRAADPVLLLGLDPVDIIDLIKIVDKTLGVLCDGQHPLALLAPDDLASAALADAVDDLFVGQDALTGGAPVDRHGRLICKAVLEHLEEYPLCPLEISGIGGIYLPVPVEGKAEHPELALESCDIFGRYNGGMDVVLYGEVFCRQTEGVPAHGIKNIIALHAALSCDDIKGRIRAGVSDMDARAGGIGELDQRIVFRHRIIIERAEGLFVVPTLLPFGFYAFIIIFHGKHFLLYIENLILS